MTDIWNTDRKPDEIIFIYDDGTEVAIDCRRVKEYQEVWHLKRTFSDLSADLSEAVSPSGRRRRR